MKKQTSFLPLLELSWEFYSVCVLQTGRMNITMCLNIFSKMSQEHVAQDHCNITSLSNNQSNHGTSILITMDYPIYSARVITHRK